MDLAGSLARALSRLVSATLSDPSGGDLRRVTIRPLALKGRRVFQFESQRGAQALHRNLDERAALDELVLLLKTFRQAHFATEDRDLHYVAGRLSERPAKRAPAQASHDRSKRRLIAEGAPVAFLQRLGVMNREGRVLAAKQDKFRQMNRYLEFVDDILDELPEGPIRVVDFGCGKSYLTFALHHFLRGVRGREVELVGLDLKREVVEDCAAIARDLKCEGLRFEVGDIAGFRGFERADLVVSLHACDTATDEALARAVAWQSAAILAVPCCQHEVAKEIRNEVQTPLLRHGILKERIASLVTDALRAELLELAGYAVQVVEFIDTEHTPKNLMIRAVRRGSAQDPAAYRAFRDAWGAHPTLARLLSL